MMKLNIKIWVLASCTVLTACSGTIHKTSKLGHVNVLSVDARQRLVLTGTRRDGQDVVCAEPSPDAVVAQASYIAAKADVAGKGSGAAGGGLSEAVGSIGLRTQTIQLLRDGYYRVCEAYLNGALNPEEYRKILRQIDQFMIALVAIEALGGVAAAPAITIGAAGKITVAADKTDIEGSTSADKQAIQQIKASTATLSGTQAEAITNIVIAYLAARKRRRFHHVHLRNHEK